MFRRLYSMFWPYDSIAYLNVAPACNVDITGFDTVAEMREVHPTVKWDGKTRTTDVETRFLNQHILARYVEVYRFSGSFPENIDILAACHKDSSMREQVDALRLELAIREIIDDMYTDRPLSLLIPEFFTVRRAKYEDVANKLRYSIAHNDMHRTLFGELAHMLEVSQSMLEHYKKSHLVTASILDVVTSLERAVFYKDALTTRFPYKNKLLCYYLQRVPMARWVYDVCKFIDIVNMSWNVTGRLTR